MSTTGTEVTRRRKPELILLRLLPHSSPVHRLWAGTKLLVVAGLAVMVSVRPAWPTLAVVAGVVGVGVVAAKVPRGAVPRLPHWVYWLVVLDGLLTLRSGASPIVHVAGVELSVGGLEDFLLLTGLAVALLAASLLVAWTTPLGEVAPALSRLAAPLRWLRLPVDEVIVAVGLAIRSLPLLIDEVRTLAAVSRLRRRAAPDASPRGRARSVLVEAHGILSTAILVTLRRARDLADAVEARGGLAVRVESSAGPRARDYALLAVMAAVVAATLVL
jgi:energy-coupling factor transporter transmembrane protein EcfT